MRPLTLVAALFEHDSRLAWSYQIALVMPWSPEQQELVGRPGGRTEPPETAEPLLLIKAALLPRGP